MNPELENNQPLRQPFTLPDNVHSHGERVDYLRASYPDDVAGYVTAVAADREAHTTNIFRIGMLHLEGSVKMTLPDGNLVTNTAELQDRFISMRKSADAIYELLQYAPDSEAMIKVVRFMDAWYGELPRIENTSFRELKLDKFKPGRFIGEIANKYMKPGFMTDEQRAQIIDATRELISIDKLGDDENPYRLQLRQFIERAASYMGKISELTAGRSFANKVAFSADVLPDQIPAWYGREIDGYRFSTRDDIEEFLDASTRRVQAGEIPSKQDDFNALVLVADTITLVAEQGGTNAQKLQQIIELPNITKEARLRHLRTTLSVEIFKQMQRFIEAEHAKKVSAVDPTEQSNEKLGSVHVRDLLPAFKRIIQACVGQETAFTDKQKLQLVGELDLPLRLKAIELYVAEKNNENLASNSLGHVAARHLT